LTIHTHTINYEASRPSDSALAEQVLNELKRISAEYVTAATEASASDLRALFRELANQTLDAHERLYTAMRSHGLIEAAFAAPQQEVLKQAQKSSEAHRATSQLLSGFSVQPMNEPMYRPVPPSAYQEAHIAAHHTAYHTAYQPLYESPYQPSPQWMHQENWQSTPPHQPIFYPPVQQQPYQQLYPYRQTAPLMPEFAQPHAMPFEDWLPMNNEPQPQGMPIEAALPEGFAGPGAYFDDRVKETPSPRHAAAQNSVTPQPFAMKSEEEDEASAKKPAKRGGKRSKSAAGAATE
jgi:hypothetical protein